MVWTTRACCPAGSLAWASDRDGLAESNPAHAGWAGLNPPPKKNKKKGVGRVWALSPAGPQVCLLRVCLAKHTLCLSHNFYAHSSLTLAKWALFNIRKFQKYLGVFIDLFVGPSHFIWFFFFVLVFFVNVLNLWIITVKYKYVCNFFLLPSKKGK